MAYEVVHNETITSPTYTVAFESFFCSEADTVGLKVYKNNNLMTTPAEYSIVDLIMTNDMQLTGSVVFVTELVTSDVIEIRADNTWKNNLAGYITYQESQANTRIGELETKVTNLQSAVSALQSLNTSVLSRLDSLEASRTTLEATWLPQITTNKNNIVTNTSDIATLKSRMDVYEAQVGTTYETTILNNQITPVEIPNCQFDGALVSAVFVDYILERSTGTDYRKSTGTLVLACKNGIEWAFDRGVTFIDVDNVSFSIETQTGVISKLSYVSDAMTGGSYTGKMTYTLRKYEV